MKLFVSLVFVFLLMFTLVGADSIGTFTNGQEMQITNYCEAGVCTYMTLTSLEVPNGTIIYPDTNMTMNDQTFNYSFTPDQIGNYKFVTCGDSTIATCDKDDFDVTHTGKETYVGINVILLLFFVSLFAGLVWLNSKVDYKKWYARILTKYDKKNYLNSVLSMIAYNFIKNTFVLYYLVGFPIVLILVDIILTFNIISMIGIGETILWVYSLGVLIVAFSFFGKLQEFIVGLIEDLKNMKWGFTDGEQ